jgi:ATP-binding cassette subfamily B protein
MRAVRELTVLLRPWRASLALALVCVVGGAALELAPPLLLRSLVDDHLAIGQRSGLLRLAVLYAAVTVGAQATGFAASYLIALAAQGGLHGLRVRLLGHLQQLPLGYFDRTSIGDTIARGTADVDAVEALFSSGVAGLATDGLRLVTIAVAMVTLSPALSVIAALIVPPLAVLTRVFQLRVRGAEGRHREAIGHLNAHLQEMLSGNEVIRSFGREEYFARRFRRVLDAVLAAFDRTAVHSALYSPTMSILVTCCSAALLAGYAADWFASASISVGTLAAFVLLFQRFFKPLIALGDEWQSVQGALTGAERILEVLRAPVEEKGHAGTNALECNQGIGMGDVSFGYVSGRPVLRDFSLRVAAGEHVALVGRTGAGKTTALQLAAGLYAPWSGVVRIAGVDPRALAPAERKRALGVVPQSVQLFSATVLDNLTFGEPVARERVERACATAGAAPFIDALPEGYGTPLRGLGGGHGVQLSAGQRQLIALARALLWDPAVILLDEATAAVDGASDAAFRSALRSGALSRGCAVLSIAHRLSTARDADRVAVVEGGRIVEMGPPSTLVLDQGLFAAWIQLETAGWVWDRRTTSVKR